MADSKISDFPVSDTLTGNELVPVVQSGTNKRTTTAELALVNREQLIMADTYTVVSTDNTKLFLLIGATLNLPDISLVEFGKFSFKIKGVDKNSPSTINTYGSDSITWQDGSPLTTIGDEYLLIAPAPDGTSWLAIKFVEGGVNVPDAEKARISNNYDASGYLSLTSTTPELLKFFVNAKVQILSDCSIHVRDPESYLPKTNNITIIHNPLNKTVSLYKASSLVTSSSATIIAFGWTGSSYSIYGESDNWAFAPKVADATGTDAPQINAIRDALIAAGIMKES